MDIVERLRSVYGWSIEAEWCAEAANEIERLREALQPFAKVLKGNWSHQSNEMLMSFGFGEDKRLELTLGDFRNASAALKEKE